MKGKKKRFFLHCGKNNFFLLLFGYFQIPSGFFQPRLWSVKKSSKLTIPCDSIKWLTKLSLITSITSERPRLTRFKNEIKYVKDVTNSNFNIKMGRILENGLIVKYLTGCAFHKWYSKKIYERRNRLKVWYKKNRSLVLRVFGGRGIRLSKVVAIAMRKKPSGILAVIVHIGCLYNIYTHRTKIATRFFSPTRSSCEQGDCWSIKNKNKNRNDSAPHGWSRSSRYKTFELVC